MPIPGLPTDAASLVGIAFFGLLLFSVVMLAAARIAEVRGATFGQACMATLMASTVTWVSVYATGALGGAGGAIAFLGGMALVVKLLCVVFRTTLGKALIILFVNVLVQIIAAGLIARMTGGVR